VLAWPSALSGSNYWIEALESDASIFGCELPIDAFLQRLSLHFPGFGLVAHCFDVLQYLLKKFQLRKVILNRTRLPTTSEVL
jgi:hypothetical protein